MKLYLVRHAEALESGQDPTRPLSEQGKLQVHNLARCITQNPIEIVSLLHSPKTRAAQTADILAQYLKPQVQQVQEGLQPNDPVEYILNFLMVQNQPLMIVGHLPYLGELAYRLTGAHFNFLPANCLCLEGARDLWTVEWFISPRYCQSS